jgi:hypothetical protein
VAEKDHSQTMAALKNREENIEEPNEEQQRKKME